MISVRRICFFALLTLFTIFSSSAATSAPAAAAREALAAASPDNAAPDFELQDLNGSTVALHSFKGQRPVLLYFWASWCPYCMAARPAVIALRNKIEPKDLEILAVNVGGGDSLAKVKKFEELHPAPFTVVYDGDGRAVRAYHVQGIPHFVLIDKDGSVKYSGNEMPPGIANQ